jgi:SAM-dependent methyltransferase
MLLKIFLVLAVITVGGFMYFKNATVEKGLISHTALHSLDLEKIKERIKNSQDLALPVEQELQILEELTKFELGKWLLENKGLNGFWTAYLILHAPQEKNLSLLEHFVVHELPVVCATRERFGIFQTQLHKYIKPGMAVASAPCGLMDDLLLLQIDNLTLYGLDLDDNSLQLAKENAVKFAKSATFAKVNAWDLSAYKEKFNVITSNGLNIYEPDDERVTELYQQFNNSLVPGGILITSFLTFPDTWQNFDSDKLAKQRAIFKDIIGTKWQSFRTQDITMSQLSKAGFEVVEIIYDKQRMFPTVVARKL